MTNVCWFRHWIGDYELASYYLQQDQYQTHTDGLGQDCSISIANALEILQSCTKPWMHKLAYGLNMNPLEVPGLYKNWILILSSQWCHNERDGVSNHQPHDCLFNPLCRRRSKQTSKLHATGLCAGNSLVTGEFPAQKDSNAENVSIWWHHHGHHSACWWPST